jgi:hypothetical protein
METTVKLYNRLAYSVLMVVVIPYLFQMITFSLFFQCLLQNSNFSLHALY